MSEVIDIGSERNKREKPDDNLVMHDGHGRPLYYFILSYDFDGSEYSTYLWAYDKQDAYERVAAMRQSLSLTGQVFSEVEE